MRISTLVSALLPCAALLLLGACDEKQASEVARIRVTASDGTALSQTVIIPLEGEESSWTVRSEEDVDIFYKEALGSSTGGWFSITDIRRTAPGCYTVNYSAQPRGNTLELRSGTVSLVSPENYLGAFISVRQGYSKVWEKTFSGDGQAILPGRSWTSPTMDGISSIQDAWLAFRVKADAIPGGSGVYPVVVSLDGGAEFADIHRTSYMLDVQVSETYGADNFIKLHISNGGRVFSSESTVKFSVPSELSSVIRLGSVSVYEIPVVSDGITGISDADE